MRMRSTEPQSPPEGRLVGSSFRGETALTFARERDLVRRVLALHQDGFRQIILNVAATGAGVRYPLRHPGSGQI